MQILIPMAGAGRRFTDAGFVTPKPLIPVGGVPMAVRAVRGLPPAGRVVFVCHPDHLKAYPAREILRREFPGCHVIATPGLTAGQASTVALGLKHLDPAEPVLVAACDNTHVVDAGRFQALTQTDAACVIWTYRNDPRVLRNPAWYGWVECDGEAAQGVSVKVPISDTPMGDHAVSGTFWFRSAGELAGAIDGLIESGERVNGEFYLDSVPGRMARAGEAVRVFEVEKYVGWGTPDELRDYECWGRHFAGCAAA